MEKISVIIPTYNRAKTIEKSVRSVLNQTYSNLEVIVVDDGSEDNTEEVIRAIEDSRLVYYRQNNSGAGAARNAGVEKATATLIAFHDSDDTWRRDKLEKQMAYWAEHPECDLIYCAYQLHRLDGTAEKVPLNCFYGELSGDIFKTLIMNNTIGTPTMLMRKSAFGELNGFDASLDCLEDWEFALRFSEHHKIGYVDEILMDVQQSMGSISARTASYYTVRSQMIAKYHRYLQEQGLFDVAVYMLFQRAESVGVLESVKKMFVLYLQEYMN